MLVLSADGEVPATLGLGEIALLLRRLDSGLRGQHIGARLDCLLERGGVGVQRGGPGIRGAQLAGARFRADHVAERKLRAHQLRPHRARLVLRPLIVDLYLGHVGRREIAGLEPRLRRRKGSGKQLRCVGENDHLLLHLLQIEVRGAQRRKLLSQHVE